MASKDKDREKEDPHRQILPHADDDAMFEWLTSLFTLSPRDVEPGKPKKEPDTFPERIMLKAVFKNGEGVGPSLKTKEWKPTSSAAPGNEQLVIIANEFLATAQQHCNVVRRREQTYGLFAFSGLKGADYYAAYPFVLTPTVRQYGEKGGLPLPASDDEDSHRDRLLATALAHSRWNQEHFTEAMSGVLALQQEIIRDQQNLIRQMEADRRADKLAAEEALSKKQERELAAEWQKAKIAVLGDVWGSVKGLLPPLVIHATKGKGGIVEGLRLFLDGLSQEQQTALFGRADEPGILTDEQAKLVTDIADGTVEPKRLTEFILSLQPPQLQRASQVLRGDQLNQLQLLMRAVSETSKQDATS